MKKELTDKQKAVYANRSTKASPWRRANGNLKAYSQKKLAERKKEKL